VVAPITHKQIFDRYFYKSCFVSGILQCKLKNFAV